MTSTNTHHEILSSALEEDCLGISLEADLNSEKAKLFFSTLPLKFSTADIKFIFNILNIYSSLRKSYSGLVDKSGLDGNDFIFPGFDIYSEQEYLHFTKHLIQGGWYRYTLGDIPRVSDVPVSHKYKRMIRCWMDIGKPLYSYDKETVIKILDSRTLSLKHQYYR